MAGKRKGKQNKEVKVSPTAKSPSVSKENYCEGQQEKIRYHKSAPWNHRLIVAVLSFAIYSKTVYPSVPGGDSGELIVAAHELGVAHPPGYPLFTLLAKAAITIIPVGSVAWRVNILSGVFAAMAATAIYSVVYKLTGSAGAGLYSTVLFSFSRLTWTWSVTAEVFSLNNLIVAILLYQVVKFEEMINSMKKDKINQVSCVGAFLCALGLCNQHTIVFYVVPIAIWVLISLEKKQMLSGSLFMKLCLCVALGLLPYVYLPLSAYINSARWTWGNQQSFEGFLYHLLRTEYGTFSLGKNEEGLGLLFALRAYLHHMKNNLIVTGPVFALITVGVTIRNRKKHGECLPVLVFIWLLYILFFSWRANLNLLKPLYKGVVERFWMQSDLVVSVLAGYGYHKCLKLLTRMVSPKRSPMSYYVPIIAALVVFLAQMQNYTTIDQSKNMVVKEFGEVLLQNLPKNSLVFTKGDLPSNSMRYLHLCEDKRADVMLVDMEVLSYAWFLPMLRTAYPSVKFPGDFWYRDNMDWPDGRRSFNFQHLLDVNYARYPIFVCIGMQEYESSWQQSYDLWPYGVCHKVVKKEENIPLDEFINNTASMANGWSYQYNQFDETSWEHVANGEMWHAKISTAFFLYQKSDVVKDEKEVLDLLLNSYQLYKDAIQRHMEIGYPSFWHKNYALVKEKLMRLNHSLDKITLCKTSIEHFNLYLETTPEDSEAASIRSAVESLKKWLKSVQGSTN